MGVTLNYCYDNHEMIRADTQDRAKTQLLKLRLRIGVECTYSG